MTEPDEPLRRVGERYLLVEQTDADDRREVWRGHDDLASRQVVVKLLTGAPGDDGWKPTFRRRADQLKALTDPGVASVLGHDMADDPAWIALAHVPGERLDVIVRDEGLTADDALAVVGQTALSLKTVHGAGLAHGAVSARHVIVRPDGSTALIGFALTDTARTSSDVTDLGRLARELLGTQPTDPRITSYLQRIENAGSDADLGDLGRSALALASALRGDPGRPALPQPQESSTEREARRPWYDDDERKRVRNRLIALGTIVVVAGAALLWIVSRGGGPTEATVPTVVCLSLPDAQKELNQAVLRVTENITDPQGIVASQTPRGGTVVKVGTEVTLTIAGSC